MSDEKVSTPIEEVLAPPERSEAAPYKFVQFGHFWFVTGRDGQHLAGPLKTAVEAKELARHMTPLQPKS